MLERIRELQAIDDAVARARDGSIALVIVEGSAGSGKSALLAAARTRADGIALTAVDDAHRLDGGTLRSLAVRVMDLGDRREVVIVAFCPDEPDVDEAALDELRTAPGAHRVTLGPLGTAAVAQLVRDHRPEADETLCRAVHESTGGNPAYVHELLSGDPARPHVVALGDRVLRRAAAISDRGAALLTAMAILGDAERLATAASVAEMSVDRADAVAHRLRRMGILAGEDPVVFAQPLVRRSIYHGLRDSERRAGHARAVGALRQAGRPLGVIAGHLAALIPDGSTEVATGLAAAAEAAPDSRQAITWLRRALQERAGEPSRAELLRRLGSAELLARDSAAIGHLREALALTSDPAARARLGIWLAEILGHAGQWDEMMAVMGSIQLDVGADTEEVRVQFASVMAVATAHDVSRVHLFDRERDELEQLSRGPSWAARGLTALLASIGAQQGDPEYALRTAERAMADGTLLAEQGGGGWAAPHLIGAFLLSDAGERALTACDEVEAASLRAGAGIGSLVAAGFRGWTHARSGDLLRAEVEFDRAHGMLADPSMQMLATTFHFMSVEVLLERPGLSSVPAAVEAIRLEPAFLDTWSGGMHLWTRGRLRLARRDRARGLQDLRALGRIATALNVAPSMVPWRSCVALALPASHRGEAIALAHEELLLARRTSLARAEGVALRALGLLEGGATAVAHLRAAVDVLEASPARLEQARALVDLGATLRRQRRRAEARAPLQAGLELATGCGAVRLAARARDELGAAAGRPPRRRLTDGALTASELRVARLAVGGASNREIARELFVTVKTVETHLSHTYAKLGLEGRGARDELSAALALGQSSPG